MFRIPTLVFKSLILLPRWYGIQLFHARMVLWLWGQTLSCHFRIPPVFRLNVHTIGCFDSLRLASLFIIQSIWLCDGLRSRPRCRLIKSILQLTATKRYMHIYLLHHYPYPHIHPAVTLVLDQIWKEFYWIGEDPMSRIPVVGLQLIVQTLGDGAQEEDKLEEEQN